MQVAHSRAVPGKHVLSPQSANFDRPKLGRNDSVRVFSISMTLADSSFDLFRTQVFPWTDPEMAFPERRVAGEVICYSYVRCALLLRNVLVLHA